MSAGVTAEDYLAKLDAEENARLGNSDNAADDVFSSGNNDKRFSRSNDTRAKYEQRIDELFNGAKADRFGGVRVLDRADILDMLGFGNMPMNIAEGKVVSGINNHPLITADVWKKIPEWIDNPAMVFNSDTESGRLVFVAPEKINGRDVRIIVEPKENNLEAHLL